MYHGLINVSFSENVAHVVNGWSKRFVWSSQNTFPRIAKWRENFGRFFLLCWAWVWVIKCYVQRRFPLRVSSVNMTKSVKDLVWEIFLREIRAENTADSSNKVWYTSQNFQVFVNLCVNYLLFLCNHWRLMVSD